MKNKEPKLDISKEQLATCKFDNDQNQVICKLFELLINEDIKLRRENKNA